MDKKTTLACGILDVSHALEIEKALLKSPGIKQASVSFSTGKAFVAYDDNVMSITNILAVINGLYFIAAEDKVINTVAFRLLWRENKASDASVFEKSLSSLSGIESVHVEGEGASSQYIVKYDRSKAKFADIQKIAESLDLLVQEAKSNTEESSKAISKKLGIDTIIHFALSVLASLPCLCLAISGGSSNSSLTFIDPIKHQLLFAVVQMIFASLTIATSNPIFIRAYYSTKTKIISTESVAALISSILVVYSIVQTCIIAIDGSIRYHSLAYGSVCSVLLVAWAYRFICFRLSLKIQSLFSQILSGAPNEARKEVEGGNHVQIASNEAMPGDIFYVRAGEGVPCDSTLMSPSAIVVDNPFFEESGPTTALSGEQVYMATLNTNQPIRVKASVKAMHGFAPYAYSMMHSSQLIKSPNFEKAAKVRQGAVIVILAFALVVGMFYGIALKDPESFFKMFSTVAVSAELFPLLVVPSLISAASCLKAARKRIFYRTSAVAESFSQIDSLLFTESAIQSLPRLSEFRTKKGIDSRMVLQLAASAEVDSGNKFGKAILKLASERQIKTLGSAFTKKMPEGGVRALISETEVYVGSLDLMQSLGYNMEGFSRTTDNFAKQGKNVIYIAVDGRVLGMAAFDEQLKKNCSEVFREIEEKIGIKCRLYSNDLNKPAVALSERIGLQLYNSSEDIGKSIAIVDGTPSQLEEASPATLSIGLCNKADIRTRSENILILNDDLEIIKDACYDCRKMRSVISKSSFFSMAALTVLSIIFALLIAEPGVAAFITLAVSFLHGISIYQNIFKRKPHNSEEKPTSQPIEVESQNKTAA